ncbi:MAG: cysteine desulfurase family protein [Acidobacteriota bacterium]
MNKIYLDYNATTPLDTAVLDTMMPYLTTHFGNAMSFHSFGQEAAHALDTARTQIAALLNSRPAEVVFTSGGTESNNMAIRGVAYARRAHGNHIITTQIEHPSIIKVCRELENEGYQVTFLSVDRFGLIDIEELRAAINARTILISVMHANNEVGTLQPIAPIGELAHKHKIYFHCDAAQSISKVPIDVAALHIDLLTVAAHKFYGPKGIGALIVREGVALHPFMLGAGHEGGRRAGTVNVAGAVGLGKACEIAHSSGATIIAEVKRLRDCFHAALARELPNILLNGHPTERLPNTLNLSFPGCDGQEILISSGVAASLGAACHTSSREPSAVLSAMGVSREDALGAIRFSFGKMTDENQVLRAASLIVQAARHNQ